MKIVCLQHAACEEAGTIEPELARRGHSLESRRLFAGEPLPEAADFDGLVVMGGAMNVYQYRDHPWLKPERALIGKAIDANRPVFGVCLGAQLIADALGARVTQNPEIEIGWYPVRFTVDAREQFPGLPAEETVLHWHGDAFELPAGAVRLASSEACSEQGFRVGAHVLALQFHAEVTLSMIEGFVETCGCGGAGRFEQSREDLLRGAERHAARANALLDPLLDAVFPGFA